MEADTIVVGAGSAGCALASRLSEDPSHRVLLLEAGGSDRRLSIRVPIGYGFAYHDPAVNWRYETEPDPGTHGRRSYWPRGKVLGGSSAINAMVYCRGVSGDYDDWRDAGNPGWGWDDVAPVFHSFERHIRPDGTAEGDGKLWVSNREPEYHPLKRHFYAAAREIGLPVVDDLNGAEGVGPYATNTRRGLRCSAADAFLRPALSRPNLTVRTNVLVERVLFEGRRAVGVAANGRYYRCRGEVILAAGAVDSPKLLHLSGIGPGAHLAALGIPVLHANDAVGAGLQDHLGINYYYRSSEPTLNAAFGTWPGRIRATLQYLLARRGPFSLSVNQIGGLVRSSPGLHRPDIQLYLNPLSYSAERTGPRQTLKPDPYPGFILSFNPCRPKSRGRIEAASPDARIPARIIPNYLADDDDLATVLAGARLLGRLQDTAAIRRLLAAPPSFDLTHATDSAILDDFRARCGTVYHPCGTCRMGKDGVVGPDLRVHGVDGLRVADASVCPNITSANTNAPAIMVGHKAATMIATSDRT